MTEGLSESTLHDLLSIGRQLRAGGKSELSDINRAIKAASTPETRVPQATFTQLVRGIKCFMGPINDNRWTENF